MEGLGHQHICDTVEHFVNCKCNVQISGSVGHGLRFLSEFFSEVEHKVGYIIGECSLLPGEG